MNHKTVTHPGTIKTVQHGKANIVVIANSACGTCAIKGACGVSESEEKIIEVELANNHQFKVGQQVEVEMKQSLGNWAVMLGYVFPFLAVLIALIVFISLGFDEGLAGIISLAFLALYYLLLFSLKNLISKKFTYSIRS